MKKTFLILLVLLCVATMAISSASAASDDIVSDDAGAVNLDDNAIDTVSSTESDFSSDNLAIDDADSSISDDSGTNDKSLESAPLKEGGTTIYVSTTGSDENDGLSEATSVATVGKGIEIVNATEGTDFTIRVANGNYNIEKIDSPAAKNVNLIGESKEGAILHASGTYGFNIYEDNISWNIENLTICDLNDTAGTSAAIRFYSDTPSSVNNCIFRNITAKNGAILFNNEGTTTISNTTIEDCYGATSSGSCIISVTGDGVLNLDNIEIHGCTLDETIAGTSTAYYLRAILYINTYGATVNLINSRITENEGPMGAILESRAKLNVFNTTISDNYINSSTNTINGGDIIIWASHDNSKINISQSAIAHNTLARSNNGVFYAQKGTTNVEYSAIFDNKLANGNNASLISGSLITAENNYWGTNERPDSKVSKWVILTANAPEMAFVGVSEAIPINLNTYNTTTGETGAVEGMPDVTLGVEYTLNNDNPATVTITNGAGTIDYLARLDGDETVTLSSGDSFTFEVNADVSTLIYVDASAETSGTGTADSPFKTIAEALNVAADGKIIVIRSGTYQVKNTQIQADITIKADKGATVILDAERNSRIFIIRSNVTLRDLTFINGDIGSNGGAISDWGNLTLSNVKFYNCTADDNGGAVYVYGGSGLTAVSCEFIDNEATAGGAIYVAEDGTANITNSKFIRNDPVYGGAIYVQGTANIEKNEFTSNNATLGGAIFINSTNAQTITENTFTSNIAESGEAIYIQNAPVSLNANSMDEGQTIYVESGSIETVLKFLNGQTVNADFGETVTITATLTDTNGNTVRGGTVTITANGETIATIDLSGDAELTTNYIVPEDATGDITISGSYSLDNEGTVVPGKIHPAVSYWFIEGGSGYETLAQAIDAAQTGDVIYYDLPDDYTEVINGKTLSKAVTIKNNGTGAVTLDANRNKMFTVSANVELNNLKFINGANAVGGFITQTSSDLNVIGCTFKDVSSTSNGAAITTSYGNLNIDGCTFENITVKQGVVHYTGSSGVLNINNSVFNNINGSYDGWVISTGAAANIANTNFTNLVSSQATSSSYYGAVYATSAMNVTGCLFKDITGPKGAAIYSTGALNVTKSVFDTIDTTFSVIYASGSSSYINYNIFVNNNKGIDSSYANCNYNFWGSNDKPSTSIVSTSRYTYWTIIDLSTSSDTVYMGTTADIAVKFMGTDGTENLTLEGAMPEYSVDLTASSGILEPTSVTIADNEAFTVFTPASEGTVTITSAQGPAELVLNVIDAAALLVVSTQGSDVTGAGTLDNPYATIAHALSQVTETRNIIYIKNTGEDYEENGLTVSVNVIIRGEDSTVTIDGGNTGQIFVVTGTLTIEDLNLTGGRTNDVGGAIFVNGGSLTVNHVTFDANGAGSGGAIGATNGASLNVTDSTFTGNMAVYGGAIYVDTTGDVSISTSTFDGNIGNDDDAIYIKTADVDLSSNTLGEDQVIFVKSGSIKTNLTFIGGETQNVEFGQTVTLTATLTDVDGNPVIGGNLVFTANGVTIATIDTANAEIKTTYTVPSDASGDIAISGSYSFDNGGTVVNGTLHPAISYWFIEGGSGYETLAQAIAAASTGDVIYGLPGTYDISGVTVNKDVTIKANESGSIILNGNGNQILRTSANVILENLTFINGSATENGGLIYIASNSLVINNSVLKDTQATGGQGAAIYVASGASNVVIENSAFDNIKTTAAAVINCRSSSSVFNVVKSNFTNMDITTNGVFYFYEGGINAIESQFINITGGDGAAIYFYGINNNNVTKCLFDNVTTTKTSGIIYSNSKSANVSYNVFLGINKGMYSSSSYGGVITADYNYWGTNDNPSDYVNSNTKLNNWVIMTVTPDTLESVEPGATQAFVVDFTHYTDGTANNTLADTIPELTVSASAVKGDLNQAAIETVNGIATFTYTASANGEETVTFTNANAAIPVSFVVGEGYFGIVYVSKDGSDDNRGDEEHPVATIAKAVELAQAGSGQIIIKEGTYNENNVTINSTIPISIKGEGNVVIDGTDLPALSIFTIKSGEVSIEKISFRNNGAKFGGAINVQGASGSSLLDANILINECSFDNLSSNASGSQGGAIYAKYLKGSLTINNSNFTNSITKSWGGALTVGYSAYEDALDLVISNCNFENNSGNNGGAAYLMANTITIVNTSFINNSATYNPGALELYNCTAIMDNCSFINNTAGNVAAAFKLEFVNNQPITSLQVTNSIFKDNVGRDGIVPAIFVDRASLNISNSILLNPLDINTSTVTGYGAVYGQGVTIANNNWWGTNENPFNLTTGTGDHVNTTIDNWVIMNVNPTETTGFTGEAVEINVDFKHTMSTDGTIASLEGSLPEELTVNANAANGTLDKNTVETSDLEAKFKFTPEFVGENIVNVYTTEANTVPVTIMAAEKYAGPIYVAKDGGDENEGSEDLPVATIAKAIELAQGKSGQVIIKEGTYVENGIIINDDIAITTVGNVILDGNGARYFDIKSGDVKIANVTITNCNNTYGGAVIRVTGGSLTIADSKIIANGGEYRDNLIRVTGASLTLNNTLFENNTAHKTSTSYGGVYVSDGVLIVDNCTFKNNYNKYGQLYVTGSSLGSFAVINNTNFIDNNASSSSGGQGAAIYLGGTAAYQYSNGTVRPGAYTQVFVVDCEFINNHAGGGTYYAGQGGAIFVNNNASLYVADSKFINNTLDDNTNGTVLSQGGAIYASAGSVYVTNSIFENNQAKEGSAIYMRAYGPDVINLNNLNITNSVIIGDNSAKLIESNYTNGSLVANNNWWATNENPSDKVTEGITVDSWVILTADPSEVTANVGQPVAITANFRHTNSTDGTIGELEGAFPELEVFGYALDDGEITESNMTVDNVATLYYTPEEVGETTVYAVAGNAMVPIKVTVTDAPQPVTGTIYVSKDGSDSNNGSEESPVATIAHAVELAKAGSGAIIIMEGTYTENNITIDSEIPLNITGQGNVVIDGTGLASNNVFTIVTSEAVVIKDITFANHVASDGGAIFIKGTSQSNLLDCNVLVDGCTFDNLKGRNGAGVYAYYTTGDLIVNNSVFTNNNATWGALCAYQAAYGEGLNVEIYGSSFDSNYANNAPAIYLQASKATIKDSNFTNNYAEYSPGAIYLQNITATIDNCIVANNSAKYEKAAIAIHGGNIQYNPTIVKPSELAITNCIIENNTGRDRAAAAIYLENSRLNMSYSSVVNDMNINNTVTATYGDEKPGLVLINNNWWGTNDPSSTIFGTNITMDNWVIMNVVANATEVISGDEVKVTVDFNHVNTTAGVIEELTGGVIPKDSYTVSLAVDNGTIAPQSLTIANGESGEAVFTAADANALITATSENAVENVLILVGEQPQPYSGVVYVSKDGDDANEGSEDSPVATLAKAIEIATGEDGSGQIVIKEGTYTGNGYNITKDLVITGEGNVILDALNEGTRLFNIGYGSGVSNFELHNLVLDNLKSFYGAAVYSYASNLVLDNITITDIDSQSSRLITSNSNTTIKDSVFANNTVSAIITQGGNNNLNIINTVIEGNNVTYDSSVFGVVYVSSGRGNLTIEDSKFYDNLVRQSTVRGYTDTNITVKGTEFINNTADNSPYYSSGGAIYAQAKLDVSDSIFINNKARRDGGAIYVGPNGQASITKSEFINNSVYSEEKGDAIYTSGATTINYCIILTNSTKAAVYNAGSNDVNAQYNWWGTNDNPQSLANAADVSNWIVMNVEADTEDVEAGAAIPFTVDFNHYIDANGEVQALADSLAQELTVSFISENGSFDNTEVVTAGQVATATYTAVNGVNDITVKSSNAVWNIVFNIAKTETSLSIEVEPITVGDTAIINVSLTETETGKGIDGVVIVNVNNEDKEVTVSNGVGTLELTGLAANTYPISAHFAETSKYESSDATGTLVVNHKETKLSIVVDDVVIGESSNITATLTDADGNPVSGTVKVTVGDKEYPIAVENGKGSVSTDAFNEIGTVDVVAKYDGDDTMAPMELSSKITVYGPGNVTVKHTDAGDAHDIQAAIDAANPGDIVRLGDYDYTDVSDVNITKDVAIVGSEGTTVTSAGDGNPIFNVPAKSENGPDSVNITGIDFKVNNGDVIVKAIADNDTNPLSIDTQAISITGNTIEAANEDVVPESVTVLQLESERGVLAPTNDIVISGNTMDAGINPFDFDVTSVSSGSDVTIPVGPISKDRIETQIVYENMSTTAVDVDTDGRVGKYFYITLKDKDNNLLANKPVQIGFNGQVYDRVTDKNGSARLQINLKNAGTYTFAVSYLGDDEYNGSFIVAKIVVSKQKGSLTVPAKSYKASATSKTLTATFKAASGKVVANKKITFTVDGKSYSATTNAKGVATVKVSLNKKGTYNFTAKFAGNNMYAAMNKTAKLTIK